jgi:chromosomal replication initiation ATPase DnaA
MKEPKITAAKRFTEICRHYQWQIKPLIGPQRERCLVERRTVIVKQMRSEGYSYPQIGKAMHRDHASIMHLANDERRQKAKERMKVYTQQWTKAKESTHENTV